MRGQMLVMVAPQLMVAPQRIFAIGVFACVAAATALASAVPAADWPQWRFDAGHTAASPAALPESLTPLWSRTYSPRRQVWDDPLNHDLMQYDRIFEPVVRDGRMFIGFNDADKVVALDTATGQELWSFYADGPVRLPAVAWDDCVFFTSDDGFLYCVQASDGQLRWKFQAAPASRKAIGNQRIVSAWPARGGPVIADGRIYFSASIWPFMGTYLYCLDAATGEVIWLNDSTATQYIKQPHSAASFAGIAPQGTMVVCDDYLLVPGGRSVPAAFDRETGELRHFLLNEGGKGNGGSLVLARGNEFYVHTRLRGVRAFELESGNKTAFMTNEPVLADTLIFAAERRGDKQGEEPGGLVLRAYNQAKEMVWELEGVDATGDLIQAGSRLYAAGGGNLTALELAADNQPARVVWTLPVADDVQRLLAGDGKLFAVTLSGKILAFATAAEDTAGPASNLQPDHQPLPTVASDAPSTKLVQMLSQRCGADNGYVLVFGGENSDLLDALLQQTRFELVVVDQDAARVQQLRRRYDAAGLYGARISLHVGTVESYQAPPHVAHLVLVTGKAAASGADDPGMLAAAYQSVRPYGGCLVVLGSGPSAASVDHQQLAQQINKAAWEQAKIDVAPIGDSQGVLVQRQGALPGAADWTHQYGNVANTVKSNDSRVKLPLGVLWFGGSSNMDVLPRHGHGPPEQVVGGRLYIQGINALNCRDVYTGRVLWKRTFDDLGTYDIYFDETYKETPLDPAYNQVHIPGATGRGTNFVATEDAIYMIEGDACHVLDVHTGETRFKIQLPQAMRDDGRQWGYIGVYKDLLLAGAGFAEYRKRQGLSFEDTDKDLSGNRKGYGSKSFDTAASLGLVAFNRHSGEVIWQFDARHSFLHNGIVAGDGRIYCLDKLPDPIEAKLRRRGINAPDTYRIVSLDAETGTPVWEQTGKIFGTWLGYSEQYDLLLLAGSAASDRLSSEIGQGMAAYRGQSGDLAWRVEDREYSGPCILHNDTILTNANSYQFSSGAFNLLDGSPKLILNPLTRQEQPWTLSRTYGCNSIIASENLLTFRSGAAGFYDLTTMSGTGNLGGFKSGCTSNLVVANGVLNAPDYTRTCSCGYQNQTSLALVHMPEMEMWTVNHLAQLTKPGQTIQRLGVNFGAPGDRVHDGTLWIDYPAVGGETVALDLAIEGDVQYQHHNSLSYSGPAQPWIGASAIMGVRKLSIPLAVQGSADEVRSRPQESADDAEEQPDGTVSLSSTDLELVNDGAPQSIGIRFPAVPIQQGTKIEAAYIQFTCDETSDDPTELELVWEQTDDAAAFREDAHNVTQRSLSEQVATWSVPAWSKEDEAGEAQRSPDLTAFVQQAVNRDGWASGNAMAVVIRGSGKRIAEAMDGSATGAPTLVVRPALPKPDVESKFAHTVRLVFAEPDADATAGQRVMRVSIQGEVVEPEFDIVQAAGAPRRTIVREYRGVMIGESLEIQLEPIAGETLLSGIEVQREVP
jgi:outer membrane protein assembly factor BamB